jgi:xanthine dehydrogenase molybdenum-binding subunit
MTEHFSVGKSPSRVDAVDKVTGRILFSADIILPNMLHGGILRSPYAHARIKHIETARARAQEGVMAVITSVDIPGLQGSGEVPDPELPCMAKEKAIFAGQPIAAVAAINPHIAEEALDLIEVEYEELPPVMDVLEAMRPDAPIIHESLRAQNLAGKDDTPSNIFWYMKYLQGDVERGFREADIVLENTFRTQTVHQGHLEPRAAVADVAPDGKITIWTDNQSIFKVRELVAGYLRLPLSRIKVMPIEVGGGFGGKLHQQLSPIAALLALKTGRPVRMVMTRAEVFKATRPSPATAITIKMGATKDGCLTAADVRMIYDFGASTGMRGLDAIHFGFNLLNPYRIPNYKIEGYDVVTNKAPSGPYRAPAAAQAAFAVESQMDLLARELGMDPLEFRLKNAVVKGDLTVHGFPYGEIGFRETLERMAVYLSGRERPKGENRGRGVACGLWSTVSMGSAAHINVNTDGSIVLVIGATDISGTRTAFAQIVAEEFGVPLDEVTVVLGDTETAPFASISVGSMTTRSTGKAVYRACQEVKEQLCRKAVLRMEVEAEDVEFVRGRAQLKNSPERSITLAELARENFALPSAGPITCSGCSEPLGKPTPVFAVEAADVEVDKETGKVRVLSYAVAQDTGLAINPAIVEGQIQGAVAQGIGWALTEGYVYEDGVMRNPTFLDYRMPTAADVPFIETMIVEVASDVTPYGIRGVGEPPMVPTLATIANAIHSAVGVRLTELPMTPEAVLSAIKSREQH